MNLTEYIPTFKRIIGAVFTKKIPKQYRIDANGKLIYGLEWTDIEWRNNGHITSIQPSDIKYLLTPRLLPLIKEEFLALIFVTNLLSQITHSMGISLSDGVDKMLLFPEIIGDCPGGCDSHLHPLIFHRLLFREFKNISLTLPEEQQFKLNMEHENILVTPAVEWCKENLDYLMSVLTRETVTIEKLECITSELLSYRNNIFWTV
jgi:hypothetical protein